MDALTVYEQWSIASTMSCLVYDGLITSLTVLNEKASNLD